MRNKNIRSPINNAKVLFMGDLIFLLNHLFQSLQHFIDGKEYPSREALETDLQYFFSCKHADFYKNDINKLVQRWENVIHSDGHYMIG